LPRSRRKRAARRRRTGRPGLGERVSALLGRQADDVWGVALVLAGVLAALGIYADLTGPLGRGLRDAGRFALGAARYGVPPVLVGLGGVLVRGRRQEDSVRAALGAGLALVATTGLLHLVPPGGQGRRPGGALGWVVAAPLRAVLASWGAGLVLCAVAVVGVLIATKLRVRAAGAALGVAARRGWGALGSGWRWAVHVGDRPGLDSAAARHPSAGASPYDFALDGSLDRLDAPTPTPPPREAPALPGPARRGDGLVLQAEARPAEQLVLGLGGTAAWRLPPLALLKRGRAAEVDRRPLQAAGQVLEEALAAHGVETRVADITVGPTVARYELELGPGVKVAKVTALSRDIAYAMAAEDVRILAPIPGKSAIGVEVPNRHRQLVHLGDVLCTEDARRAGHPLEVALGRDISGRAVIVNLADMPHLLIAGATGSGKSSCIHSILTSVLCRSTPEQIRLILVDPKRVELGRYEGVPHLLTGVVVNPKRAANALQWAVTEMERRYDLLAEVGARDITGYNAAYDRGELRDEPGQLSAEPVREYHRLPFILVVVDELNDLMLVAARDVEESICRIAQMARAVGIHLIIATQRPSVDVITGVIKANIPSRLAFKVSSVTDSRVILDQQGADKLIGTGDLLLLSASMSLPRRIQGAWVGEDEIRKVVAHWRRQAAVSHVPGVQGEDVLGGAGGDGAEAARSGYGSDEDDELADQAMEMVVRSQLGSTSMLQRKLRVGFARAGRLMDLLERRGVVGPSEGSKPRAVLMTVDELEALSARTARGRDD